MLSVLIPYRPDTERRARLHVYTSRLWAGSGVQVVYHDDGLPGLFSFSRAINLARKQATGKYLLSYSVDALPPSPDTLGRLMATLESGFPWVAGWRGQIRFTEWQTQMLLNGGSTEAAVGPPSGGICLGREALIAVRADAWDELGGYDERFVGWGPEDKAWHLALKTVFPAGCDSPTEGLFKTLSHPSTPRTQLAANIELFREYVRRAVNPAEFRKWYSSITRHNSLVSTQ